MSNDKKSSLYLLQQANGWMEMERRVEVRKLKPVFLTESDQPYPFVYPLLSAFLLQWQSWIIVIWFIWPQSLKHLLSALYIKGLLIFTLLISLSRCKFVHGNKCKRWKFRIVRFERTDQKNIIKSISTATPR